MLAPEFCIQILFKLEKKMVVFVVLGILSNASFKMQCEDLKSLFLQPTTRCGLRQTTGGGHRQSGFQFHL